MALIVRRTAPWLIGLLIIVAIATHVPLAQFRASIGHGPHLRLIAVELLIAATAFGADSIATWVALWATQVRWTLGRVFAIRGATYLLMLVNYAVGQGGLGYYLYRGGEPALRAAGITLFLLGTNLATLLMLTFGVWVGAGRMGTAPPAMWWFLVVGNVGFVLYLVLVYARFPFLSRRQLFQPLFDAGIRGHLVSVAARMPHITVNVLGIWVAMRAWGIPVPFLAAATLMPAVALAGVLPISPSGLGTMQAALVYFFSNYAAGGTADTRSAAVLAFGIVHFVYSVGSVALVGLACLPLSRRAGIQLRPSAQ